MKNKKGIIGIIIAFIVVIAAVVAIIILLNNDTNKNDTSKEENNNIENNEKPKEKNYGEKYIEYLEKNIFNNKEEVSAVLIDFENDEEPELLLKYLNERKATTLKILYIRGDEVRESKEYAFSYLRVLYDVENEQPSYYIETKNSNTSYYYLVKDILTEKSDAKEIKEDDNFAYKYVKPDINVDMYTISKEDIESNMSRLIDKYNSFTSFVDEEEIEEVEKKIIEIKSSLLKKDENGIYSGKYKIAYGVYVYADEEFTLNKDDSAEFHPSYGIWSGSYYLENDMIRFVANGAYGYDFKIIGDNKIQLLKNNTIWNLK